MAKGDPSSGLLPFIIEGGPGVDGSADKGTALAASLAIDKGIALQDLPYDELRKLLLDKGLILQHQPK